MGSSVTISDIYYQIQDQWQAISEQPEWRLAIWISPVENIDVIDKFLEIERSPAGSANDVFFRFETEYAGDNKLFTRKLWEEYHSWFTEELPEEYDILKALQKDGEMNDTYVLPDISTPVTLRTLWGEFLRLKSCIKGLENRNFCIYFPPAMPEGPMLTDWFRHVLNEGVPQGIRLVTIDYTGKRKISLPSAGEVVHLKTNFDLKAAINNEMDKECDTYDSTSFGSQYQKQIRRVMEISLKRDCCILDKEVRTLLAITDESPETSVRMTTPLIASQAYYSIGQFDKSMTYVNEAIRMSGDGMTKGDINGYPVWKVSMFQKAAILVYQKKWDKGVETYNQTAKEATRQQDAFYIMESYRMCGYLMYELGKKEDAFEYFLLSLAGGSYLEKRVRRESTFLYSAHLALLLGEDVRPKKMEKLEEQLQIWLGEDWHSLVYSEQMSKSTIRRKSSFFR